MRYAAAAADAGAAVDESTQRQLVKRILTHVEQRSTDLAPVEREYPVRGYLDTGLFDREISLVHTRRPILVAHVSQLAEPGDFVTDELYGVPIVLMRRSDGRIGGYVNVCRHRRARLVSDSHGRDLKDLVCPYHAWRYDDGGRLTHIPDGARCFPGVDLSRRGLLPVRTWVRCGFVWVNLADESGEPAQDEQSTADRAFLDPLVDDFAAYGFENDTVYRTERLTGDFNWKIGVEAFLEVYHFRTLHPAMRKYVFVPEVSLVDQLGAHLRLVAPKRDVLALRDQPEERWLLRPHATIVYFIFPATLVFVEKRHATTMQIRPTGPGRCELRTIHVVRDDGLRRMAALEENLALFGQAIGEDIAACESLQANLASGVPDVVFGRNELGLHLFRDSLARELADG